LVDRLLDDGYDVIGLDNLMTGDLANLDRAGQNPHFHLEIGDVRESLKSYASLIFNLACPASPVHYQTDPHATLTTSVVGALRLVEHARARRCRIVHTSTSEVYGDPLQHPQAETYWGNVNPIGERACYDEGKRAAETILVDAARSFGADTRIVRVFNTYGPRMAFNDGRVISNFILQALRGEPITIFGDGMQSRSFCYVDDLIEGLMRAARAERFDSPVNLGNPEECSILELAERIAKLAGRPAQIRHLPLPADDPRQRRPDLTKAQQLLGYAPTVPLELGIQRTYADFRQRLADAPEPSSPAARSVGA
jgi:UDP-glucuronate decarboxylase